jgi:biotin transporter BioY
METFFGLTADQILVLAGLGVVLLLGLIVLKFVLKLSMSFIRLGCLAIFVIMLIACIAMLA